MEANQMVLISSKTKLRMGNKVEQLSTLTDTVPASYALPVFELIDEFLS